MLLRIVLLSVFFLSGCIVINNKNTGETTKLTIFGAETVEPTKENIREKLPTLDIRRDNSGFTANGEHYIDPFGPIIHLSEISDTGFVTYTIRGENENDYIVKLIEPLKSTKPKTLGVLQSNRGLWHYLVKDGRRYSGNWFRLTSKGVILNQDDNIVTYFSPELPIKTHVLPDGYGFTSLQKGDISKSKHLLIQKQKEQKKILGFVSVSTLARQFDFILFNLENGKISAEIQDVNLRGESDAENMSHLENTFYLFNTASGAISLTLEDNYKKFVARNLTTGQTKVAFEREQGVSHTKAVMHSSGRIALSASIGLSNDKIIDLENFMLTGSRDKQLGEL